MNNFFKKVYHLNKRAYKEFIDKDTVNTKTGISQSERKRLQNYPALTEGKVDVFGKTVNFIDAPGFLHSLDEIFAEEIYKFISDKEDPFIIDCGANIGLSIIYFKQLYPKSKIICFEPDENAFNILKKNTLEYNDSVELHNEAVWIENTDLCFFSEGSLAGSLVVDFVNKNNIKVVKAIDFKKHLIKKIDFLKIDIEGAENQLIFDIENHLDNVNKLFLEYHGIIGEKQNLGKILNLLTAKGFEYYIRLAGETINYPFCDEKPKSFNQQLNILCYRKSQ
jgi:FkbM family methyltransferase